MMKAYEWMLDHTDWQVKTVGGVWYFFPSAHLLM